MSTTLRPFSVLSVRGPRGVLTLDGATVRTNDDRSATSAVVARIERETGLRCCAGVASQGHGADYADWSATFGRPLSRRLGGGSTPVVEVTFRISGATVNHAAGE